MTAENENVSLFRERAVAIKQLQINILDWWACDN